MADTVREMGAKCRNWSRWGPNDELGTLNYIAPETIVRATRAVRRGVTFSLAIPFDNTGPQINQPRRFNPIHRMILTGPDFTTGAFKRPGGVGFADDMVIMALQCGTQWDALSHCFLDGRLYNGYDANPRLERGRQEERYGEDGALRRDARRAARPAAREGRRLARAGLRDHGGRSGGGDERALRRDREGRRAAGPHGADGDVPRPRGVGRLCGRRRARALLLDRGVDPPAGARRAGDRHVGDGGPAQRDPRHLPAAPPGAHPEHGAPRGRDLRPRRSRRRLREGQGLRVPVRRAAAADHGRGRLTGEPARDQIRSHAWDCSTGRSRS